MVLRIALVALLLPVALAAGCSSPASTAAQKEAAPVALSSPSPTSIQGPPSAREDPAVLRRELLAILDARIDEMATKARLDARLALDVVVPVPYLGLDSDPSPQGLVLNAVYADTGAKAAGLRKGDVLVRFDGVELDSKATLARSVRSRRIGETVAIDLVREGTPMTIQARLGARPEEDEDEAEQFPDLVPVKGALPPALDLAFDADAVGALPSSLESRLGGHGRMGAWIVVAADKGRALRQDDGDKTGVRFPMVVAREWKSDDAVARVRFRYVAGDIDRAAGVVLRFRDPGNYLIARANAAEGDLRIFRVVNGDRRTLPGAIAKGATDDDQWHTLEFRVEGSELTAILDGTVKATARDTFFTGGRPGLWTKSDSRTEFDDWRVDAIATPEMK